VPRHDIAAHFAEGRLEAKPSRGPLLQGHSRSAPHPGGRREW